MNTSIFCVDSHFRLLKWPWFCVVLVLNLFQVVSFENGKCNNSDATEYGGCYTKKQCDGFGGKEIAKCAGEYGVCCQGKGCKTSK